MGCSIFRCAQEPEFEALETPSSPFGLVFKALDAFKPGLVVVVSIYDLQTEGLGIAGALVLADLIFLARVDIWIAVIYDGSDPVFHQTLDDGTRTWGTAGVKENLRLPKRHLKYFFLFCHGSAKICIFRIFAAP